MDYELERLRRRWVEEGASSSARVYLSALVRRYPEDARRVRRLDSLWDMNWDNPPAQLMDLLYGVASGEIVTSPTGGVPVAALMLIPPPSRLRSYETFVSHLGAMADDKPWGRHAGNPIVHLSLRSSRTLPLWNEANKDGTIRLAHEWARPGVMTLIDARSLPLDGTGFAVPAEIALLYAVAHGAGEDHRKNPDPRLRELERAAAAGDPEAAAKLEVARNRHNLCATCGKPFPERAGSGVLPWANRGNLRDCWACAAVRESEALERSGSLHAWPPKWSGYVSALPPGWGGTPWGGLHREPSNSRFITNFVGFPLVIANAARTRQGWGGRGMSWRGVDRYGREWWSWNRGPGMITGMNLVKRDRVPGRTHYQGPLDAYEAQRTASLREAQDLWLQGHGADPLPAAFNPAPVRAMRNGDARIRELQRAFAETGDRELLPALRREAERSMDDHLLYGLVVPAELHPAIERLKTALWGPERLDDVSRSKPFMADLRSVWRVIRSDSTRRGELAKKLPEAFVFNVLHTIIAPCGEEGIGPGGEWYASGPLRFQIELDLQRKPKRLSKKTVCRMLEERYPAGSNYTWEDLVNGWKRKGALITVSCSLWSSTGVVGYGSDWCDGMLDQALENMDWISDDPPPAHLMKDVNCQVGEYRAVSSRYHLIVKGDIPPSAYEP